MHKMNQSSLLAALATPGNEDASITAELPSLVQLSKNAAAIRNLPQVIVHLFFQVLDVAAKRNA